MERDARAFWLRAPGARRDPGRAAARARPGRGAGPHPVLRGQPGHRDAGLPRRGAGEPVRRDARAVPGGRLPGPGEVRLPQRRRGRAGPGRRCSGAPCSASTRTRPATSCRPSAVTPVPDGVPAGAGGAGRHGGDRGERAVGRRAAGRRPGRRGRRRAWSAAASPRCSPGSPASGSQLVDADPARAGVADGARRRLRRARATPPATATSSCTPAPPAAGLHPLAGAARPGGHGPRAELVRRPAGQRAAGRGVPLPAG